MSDLSRLLDDVYGDLGSASATPPAKPPTPDADGADDAGWAGGDDAFGTWADDHGARLDGDDAEPTAAVEAVPALSGATGALFLRDLGTGPGEATAEVPVAGPTWHRSDDDILPEGRARSGRRRGRGANTTPPAAGASIEDFAAEGSAFDALAALDAAPPATGEHPVTTVDGDGDGDATEAAAPAAGRRRGLRRR